jgi:hypothetical protein
MNDFRSVVCEDFVSKGVTYVLGDTNEMTFSLGGFRREGPIFDHVLDRLPEVEGDERTDIGGLPIEFLKRGSPGKGFCGGVIEHVTNVHETQ